MKPISHHFICYTFVGFFLISPALSKGPTRKPKADLDHLVKQNLIEAMRREAFDYLTYLLYAKAARKHGYRDLARMYEKAALTERLDHFNHLAQVAGLIGTEEENLKFALGDEAFEVQHLYPQWSLDAYVSGENEVVEVLSKLVKEDHKQQKIFTNELKKLLAH